MRLIKKHSRSCSNQTPGPGSFSTCSRKDASGATSCKVAMFRARPELRVFASGDPSATNAEALYFIVEKMQNEGSIDITLPGPIAGEQVKGKSSKFIFQGAV